MGTQQSQIFDPSRQGWEKVNSISGITTWYQQSTGELMEQYQFMVATQKQFNYQTDAYNFRLNNPVLVASKYLQKEIQNQACSSIYVGRLFLEKIQFRLKKVKEIPYPDIIHLYSQSFQGFSQLYKQVGGFNITEQMIGVNNEGVVKVWLNSDFGTSLPDTFDTIQIRQIDMLYKLVDMIELNTDHQTCPIKIKQYLQSKNVITFNEAYLAISQRFSIPRRMESVLEDEREQQLKNGMVTFGGDTSMHKRIEVSDIHKISNFSLNKKTINSNISKTSQIPQRRIDVALPTTTSLDIIPTTRTQNLSPRVNNNITNPRPLSNKHFSTILKPQSITTILQKPQTSKTPPRVHFLSPRKSFELQNRPISPRINIKPSPKIFPQQIELSKQPRSKSPTLRQQIPLVPFKKSSSMHTILGKKTAANRTFSPSNHLISNVNKAPLLFNEIPKNKNNFISKTSTINQQVKNNLSQVKISPNSFVSSFKPQIKKVGNPLRILGRPQTMLRRQPRFQKPNYPDRHNVIHVRSPSPQIQRKVNQPSVLFYKPQIIIPKQHPQRILTPRKHPFPSNVISYEQVNYYKPTYQQVNGSFSYPVPVGETSLSQNNIHKALQNSRHKYQLIHTQTQTTKKQLQKLIQQSRNTNMNKASDTQSYRSYAVERYTPYQPQFSNVPLQQNRLSRIAGSGYITNQTTAPLSYVETNPFSYNDNPKIQQNNQLRNDMSFSANSPVNQYQNMDAEILADLQKIRSNLPLGK